MTYGQFLFKLRTTARRWTLDEDGALHLGTSAACPYIAVCDLIGAFMLSDGPRTHEIFSAADNTFDCDPLVRRDLLAACGLVEVEDPCGVH